MAMRQGWRALRDPFNRRTFPWGGRIMSCCGLVYPSGGICGRSIPPLCRGDIQYRAAQGPLLAFTRSLGEETILAAFNAGNDPVELRLEDEERIELLLGAARFQISAQGHVLTLPPHTGSLLRLSVVENLPEVNG